MQGSVEEAHGVLLHVSFEDTYGRMALPCLAWTCRLVPLSFTLLAAIHDFPTHLLEGWRGICFSVFAGTEMMK
jgi:hypothetical protein